MLNDKLANMCYNNNSKRDKAKNKIHNISNTDYTKKR